MRIATKPYVLAVAAALPLALGVGAASARNLSWSSQTFRMTWTRLDFTTDVLTGSCPVTLEGSFHSRTLAKVAGTLVGAITAARAKEESCVNGRAHLKNLPWHLTYERFTGTLPNISGVVLLLGRFRFEVIVPGVCTGDYGEAADNLTARANRDAGGTVTGIEFPAGSNFAHLVTSLGVCTSSLSLDGDGTMTVLNSSARLTVTLI